MTRDGNCDKPEFTVAPRHPYSPDVTHSNFWLFSNLKKALKGQHFSLDVKAEVTVCM